MTSYEVTVTYFVTAEDADDAAWKVADAIDGSTYPWEMLEDAAEVVT